MIKYNLKKFNTTAEDIYNFIEAVKYKLDNPAIYNANELNSIHKPWDAEYKSRGLICIPVDYTAGINNLGVGILYNMVNEQPDLLLERSYMPDQRLYKYLIKNNLPIMFGWESKHPAWEYDWIGFSLYFELQFFNMVDMMHKSGIPIYTEERFNSREYPVIIVGGVAAYSCEPIADFVDAVFIGDGEAQILDAAYLIGQYKRGEIETKEELLLRMTNEIQGVYVPYFYEFEYEDD